MRLLAHEVLILHLGTLHARLDDRVLALQLGSEGPVALLEPPRRAVDADPAGRESVRLTRLPENVPQPGALLDRHVQLPAEVADVRDAGGECELRADLDRRARSEREPLVGDVRRRDALQDVARARPPEPDRRP